MRLQWQAKVCKGGENKDYTDWNERKKIRKMSHSRMKITLKRSNSSGQIPDILLSCEKQEKGKMSYTSYFCSKKQDKKQEFYKQQNTLSWR